MLQSVTRIFTGIVLLYLNRLISCPLRVSFTGWRIPEVL